MSLMNPVPTRQTSPKIQEIAVLKKVEAENHHYKGYRLLLKQQKDGFFIVTQEWGRIGNQPKQLQNGYNNYSDAKHSFEQLLNAKKRKGYLMTREIRWPDSHKDTDCLICRSLHETDPQRLIAQFRLSILLTTTFQDQECLGSFLRQHISGLFHLDSASQMSYLAELRKCQTVLHHLAGDNAFDIIFPASNHLTAYFIPATPQAVQWLKTPPFIGLKDQLAGNSYPHEELNRSSEHERQLNLLDLLDDDAKQVRD